MLQMLASSDSDFSGYYIKNRYSKSWRICLCLTLKRLLWNNLKQDLEKVARFVNDQEEELSWQCKAVEELEAKIADVGEFERFTLEQELADEKEAKKMLDQTLVGQRRSLRERHQILLQHSRVLKRRHGIIDFDFDSEIQDIDLSLIKKGLEEQYRKLQQQQKELAQEIAKIEQSIQELETKLEQQKVQKDNLESEITQKQDDWNKLNLSTVETQSKINFYQEQLQPLQDTLDLIINQVQDMNQLMAVYNERNPHDAVEKIKLIVEDLMVK